MFPCFCDLYKLYFVVEKIFPGKIKFSLLDPTLLFVLFWGRGCKPSLIDTHLLYFYYHEPLFFLFHLFFPGSFFPSGKQSHFTNKILIRKWCISSFYSGVSSFLFPCILILIFDSVSMLSFFVLLLWVFLYFSPCDHHLPDYVLTCIIFWTVLIQEKQDTLTTGHVPYMLICMLMFVILWRISILML